MLLSIIIPVYNDAVNIKRCLNSLITQDLNNVEIIVVDDGSTDSSAIICDNYSKSYKNIRVIHKINQGVSIARQVGTENATGEYIAFIDSDDWVTEDYIVKIKHILNSYNCDLICFGFFRVTDGKVKMHPVSNESKYMDKSEIVKNIFPFLISDSTGKLFPNAIWDKVVRRSLYIQYQVKDKKIAFGEDGACIKPCIYHADSVYFLSNCLYYYFANHNSATQSNKVRLWEDSYSVYLHLENNIDMNKYDLQSQNDRLFVHSLFNVALSQFNCKSGYFDASNNIKKALNNNEYMRIIRRSKFIILSKGNFARFLLVTKNCALIYLFWNIKGFIKRITALADSIRLQQR